MFEDIYLDDPELQQALIDAGYYTDPVRAPAVMPSTVEAEPIMGIGSPAAAPNYLGDLGLSDADLASLYALSAGSSGGAGIGGLPSLGNLGANYVDTSGAQLVTAPISNKGNPTAYGANNQFYIQPNELVRVVDRGTNSVIFEGVGPDAAREAVKIGQNLTDTMGRKANYQIQAGLTPDRYVPVANEKFNKTDLQNIANAVGTVAPLAAAFIPGLNLGVLGSIGAGAGLGGVSAGLRGDNILKGAAIGGLSAAGAQYLGPALEAGGQFGTTLAPRLATAIGTGIGSTAGGLVTGQNLKNSLLGGVASGAASYLSPDIAKGLGIGGGSSASTSGGGGGGGGGGPIVVSGYAPSSIGLTLGGSQNKIQQALKPRTEAPYSGLTVTGNGIGSISGLDFGGNRFGAPGADTSALDRLTEAEMDQEEIDVLGNKIVRAAPVSVPLSPDVQSGIAEFEKNPIIAKGSKIEQATASVPNLDLDLIDRLSGMENDLATDDIVVTGNKAVPVAINLDPGFATVSDTLPLPKMDPRLTEKSTLDKIKDAANLANAVSVLVPLAGGVLGGGGGGGTMAPDTSGLTFTKSPLRPTTPGAGIGGIGGRYPYTPTTYGRAGGDQETEYMFFTRDPVTGATTAQATTRVAPASISSGIAQQSPITTMTAAQPNSARYEEAVSRGSMTPQERALMRLVDSQQAAAVNPTELSQKLLDRAAQVEAINQRYKSQYGLQDSDIEAMFQGTYGLNMADSANSPNFEAARLISSPYRSELENIYGDLPTMRLALSSPVNALGRTRDSLSQLEVARNRAQQSLVDTSSPEYEQQYLAYMTGATEQMPPAPIGFTPEEYTRRMEIVRGYGPDIAYDTIKNWNDTRSEYPDRVAAERADYESVRNDAAGTYNYALADLNRGAGIQSATAPITAAVNPADIPVIKEGGEISDDMVKHLVDYHKNGGHRGPGQVKGIGSGQEDKIPAYLSDGEYVWSAQDVSDLGDGSNREGVRRLDEMRKMVRQQAGRKDVKKIAKPQKGIDRMLKAVGGMA